MKSLKSFFNTVVAAVRDVFTLAPAQPKFVHLVGKFNSSEILHNGRPIADTEKKVVKATDRVCEHSIVQAGDTTFVLWNNNPDWKHPDKVQKKIQLNKPDGSARENHRDLGDRRGEVINLQSNGTVFFDTEDVPILTDIVADPAGEGRKAPLKREFSHFVGSFSQPDGASRIEFRGMALAFSRAANRSLELEGGRVLEVKYEPEKNGISERLILRDKRPGSDMTYVFWNNPDELQKNFQEGCRHHRIVQDNDAARIDGSIVLNAKPVSEQIKGTDARLRERIRERREFRTSEVPSMVAEPA